MLPLKNRLNLKKQFRWVAQGKSVENKLFKLFFRIGANDHPLIGIALNARNFKQAVDRNRARRLFSKAIELLYNDLTLKNINIVALPKTTILDVKSGDVLTLLEDTLKEQRIINERPSS